jgi:hypothetical protein
MSFFEVVFAKLYNAAALAHLPETPGTTYIFQNGISSFILAAV